MGVLESDDLADDSLFKLFGMAQRPTGKLHHPLKTLLAKTLTPLIAGFCANPIFLA
jgi:hypothetical protein